MESVVFGMMLPVSSRITGGGNEVAGFVPVIREPQQRQVQQNNGAEDQGEDPDCPVPAPRRGGGLPLPSAALPTSFHDKVSEPARSSSDRF